jgi:hypothetical protein
VSDLGISINRSYLAAAIALIVLVAGLAMELNRGSIVAYASVERIYFLAPGDAVVYHRNGLNFGQSFLNTTHSFKLGNFTVCVRIMSGFGFSSKQPVIDYGVSGTNTSYWRIEAVPVSGLTKFNYRFSLNTSNGIVSVDVPGELYKFHIYCFAVSYSSNGGVINAYVDGYLYNSVSFSGSVNIGAAPLFVGAYANITYLARNQPIWTLPFGKNYTVTLLLVYNRTLSVKTEVIGNMTVTLSEYSDIASGVIPSDGLVLYFDPSVADWYRDVFVDLSGNGNDLVPHGVLLAFADYTDMFVIKTLYRDNYVHFQYFPWYSRIEIYDLAGTYYQKFVVEGSDNGFGRVIDYTVSLSSCKYRIVYYDPNENVTVTATRIEIPFTVSSPTAVWNATIGNVYYAFYVIPKTVTATMPVTVTVATPVTVTLPPSTTITSTVVVPAATITTWIALPPTTVTMPVTVTVPEFTSRVYTTTVYVPTTITRTVVSPVTTAVPETITTTVPVTTTTVVPTTVTTTTTVGNTTTTTTVVTNSTVTTTTESPVTTTTWVTTTTTTTVVYYTTTTITSPWEATVISPYTTITKTVTTAIPITTTIYEPVTTAINYTTTVTLVNNGSTPVETTVNINTTSTYWAAETYDVVYPVVVGSYGGAAATTTTSTVYWIVKSPYTVTTTVYTGAPAPSYGWLILLAMIAIIGVAIFYLVRKRH